MLFKYESLIRNIFSSWVALAAYLMIKYQIVCGPTAALNTALQIIKRLFNSVLGHQCFNRLPS